MKHEPQIQVGSTAEILDTLDRITLSALADRVAALPSRFDAVLVAAAELMEPDAQFLKVPRRMLKTEADIAVWIGEVEKELKSAIEKGPIVIQ